MEGARSLAAFTASWPRQTSADNRLARACRAWTAFDPQAVWLEPDLPSIEKWRQSVQVNLSQERVMPITGARPIDDRKVGSIRIPCLSFSGGALFPWEYNDCGAADIACAVVILGNSS